MAAVKKGTTTITARQVAVAAAQVMAVAAA
jgi:hypothetical protein